MFRRVVSSLMLVGFVAGQWAAMPHVHAAPTSTEHDDRPHVHLSEHEHSHSHGGSTHTHSVASPTESHAEDPACAFASTGIDHDADAVYRANSSSDSSGNAGASVADITSDWLMPTSVVSTTVDSSVGSVAPAAQMAPTFALCLELRALRI